MNAQIKQRIDEKLNQLSAQRIAEVLDFVEFLEARERSASPLRHETTETPTDLAEVEQGLAERFSEADERPVNAPSQRIEDTLALMRAIIKSPPKARMGPPYLDLTGFKFNRDEANER
jgi:hypothetical protein